MYGNYWKVTVKNGTNHSMTFMRPKVLFKWNDIQLVVTNRGEPGLKTAGLSAIDTSKYRLRSLLDQFERNYSIAVLIDHQLITIWFYEKSVVLRPFLLAACFLSWEGRCKRCRNVSHNDFCHKSNIKRAIYKKWFNSSAMVLHCVQIKSSTLLARTHEWFS